MGIITDIILPLALAFIMFALGLGLTVNDFLIERDAAFKSTSAILILGSIV